MTATSPQPTPTDRPLDGPAILERASAAARVLRQEAAANERARRLTPRTVDALRATGVFRMAMPRSWGGPEVPLPLQVEVVEALSHADGSAGWCAMIGSAGGFHTAALDDDVGRALYPDLDAVTAGWVLPAGQLEVVEGGYRLSGRWQFGSGCTHAQVVLAGARVVAGGEPVTGPAGEPETRVAVLPADRFRILDTWDTTGLAGTGSHDYEADGAFVPAGQAFRWQDRRREGPLYAWPGLFVATIVGVPLGIARAALEVGEAVLAERAPLPERRPSRDEPGVRVALARAEALVGSARAYAREVVGDVWATLEAGDLPAPRQRAALAGAYVHVARSCREGVELLAEAVGTPSVARGTALERHRRDLATVGLHLAARPRLLELVGALWLPGAELDHPLLRHGVF